MFDDRNKYSLDTDLECLRGAGKIVLSHTTTTKGWAILWYDKAGYTVTYTERHGRGVGGTRSFEEGSAEYLDTVRRLL